MNLLRYRRAVVAALATTALLGAAGAVGSPPASAAETHAQNQGHGHGHGHGKGYDKGDSKGPRQG